MQIGKVKLMFLELENKSFDFNHYCKVLRFHPKWMDHIELAKSKKKSQSNSNDLSSHNYVYLNEDEDAQIAFSHLYRQSAVKLKMRDESKKRKKDLDLVVILCEMDDGKKNKIRLIKEVCDHDKELFFIREREMGMKEQMLLIRERWMHIKEHEICLVKENEGKMIMILNISVMPTIL